MSVPNDGFWRGRRVLLTGHTGFKGSWLACWLQQLGSEVFGVSLPEPPSSPCLWDQLDLAIAGEVRGDVAGTGWQEQATAFDPDVLLHLAAQPLVSVGYEDPVDTFTTNVLGTVRVLDALDRLPRLDAALVVTTDKVYDVRQPHPHHEGAFLGGRDPYSASKAAAELVVGSWPRAEVPLATARAGNVIGGGDWARDRILPDLVRAWSAGDEVVLRRPDAVRPWQHVVEPLAGYLAYVERLAGGDSIPTALNFGPVADQQVAVLELVEHAATTWARLRPRSRPVWRVQPAPALVETGLLTLDSTAADEALGWRGRWDWRVAVEASLEWYDEVLGGGDPRAVTSRQLAAYEDAPG